MKTLKTVASLTLGALVAAGISVPPGATEEPKKKEAPAAAMAAPVYRPPLRGAPVGRVGGGTRGTAGRDMFVLSVLAPDDSGLTVSEQPSLYWFISSSTVLPVEVIITDPRTTQPVVEARLPAPVQAGMHRIRLADHGVRLAPGVAYRWSVSVVADPNRRSRDILAGGLIERVDPPAGLREKLTQAPREEFPFLYADAGLWYDAFAAVSDLIEKTPGDAALLKQRAALLAQVGLPELGDEGTRTPR